MKHSLFIVIITVNLFFSTILIIDAEASRYTSGADLTNPVSGRITQDTTWTKANSPYQFEDDVCVEQGVTLTIEPGVKIEFWMSQLLVEGTIRAIGSDTDKITFSHNIGIHINEKSSGWNEQTGTGNIFENCQNLALSSINAVKINKCTTGALNVGGHSILTNNHIVGEITANDSTIVWGNTINGTVKVGTSGTPDSFPIIGANDIFLPHKGEYGKSGIDCRKYVWVVDNSISNCYWGISVGGYLDAYGYPIYPNARIERNSITDCYEGIIVRTPVTELNGASSSVVITDNTITENKWGIHLTHDARYLIITGNNIQGNSNYSICHESIYNLNAESNWFGTTDSAAINQSIFDHKQQPHLGTVDYTPFLKGPNVQAHPAANQGIPTVPADIWATSQPTENSTTTPNPTDTATFNPQTDSTPKSTQPSPNQQLNLVSQPPTTQSDWKNTLVFSAIFAFIFAIIAAMVLFAIKNFKRITTKKSQT